MVNSFKVDIYFEVDPNPIASIDLGSWGEFDLPFDTYKRSSPPTQVVNSIFWR